MQVVAEEIGAGIASVTIIHSEEGALGPNAFKGLLFGLHYVQDYGHTVLVVVAADALVRVGAVPSDYSVVLAAELSVLIVRHQAVHYRVRLVRQLLLQRRVEVTQVLGSLRNCSVDKRQSLHRLACLQWLLLRISAAFARLKSVLAVVRDGLLHNFLKLFLLKELFVF